MVVRSRNAIILSIWLAVLSLCQRRCFVESFISSEFSVLQRKRGNSYRLHAVTRARGKQTSPPKEERTVKRYSPVNEERRSHYSPVKRQLRNQSPPRNSTLIEAIERKQDIYSALSMAKGGKADAALKLFESLVVSGECVIRRKECNLLIKELGDNGFLQHCNDVLRIMKRVRISPSLITYSTLISRAGSWLKVSLAEEYFREMMSLKIAPDLSCYNSLINAYAKVGNTAQAVEIFESMASEGGVAPNVVTYNTIVDAFARVGNTFQILTLMRRMRSENITANERTYCALIQSYCFNDQVGVALNLTSQLERDKYRVSEITYSTLLHSLGRAGDLNSTFDLLRSMRAKGIRLNMVTMSSLIDACAKHGQLSLALRLYEDMQRSSRKQDRPNSITCSSLVDACLKNKQVDQAFKILQDMREQDIKLTEVTYTSLISELTRLNMLDRIEEIFQGAPQVLISYKLVVSMPFYVYLSFFIGRVGVYIRRDS